MQNESNKNSRLVEQNTLIDVLKYGFILTENDEGVITYEKRVANIIICLIDCSSMFTLYYWQNESKVHVANRYIVESQEQFDFLINNGRLGWAFNSLPM